jgi:uncharacterized protein (DUF983 family)
MGLFRRTGADDRIIDLRDHIVNPPPPARRAKFGLPTRCPSCHGISRLDTIDVVRRTMAQTCTECGLRFDTAEADLEAANARLG